MSLNKDGKKIISIHLGKKKVILRFEDETKSISLNTYLNFRLYENKILSKDEIEEIDNFNEIDKYLEYSKNIISRYLISEKTLHDKLIKKGLNEDKIGYIIAYLKENKLLDDVNYGKALFDELNYKCYGKYRIIEYLKKKGLNNEFISSLIFDEDDEINKIYKLIPSLNKKYSKYNFSQKRIHIINSLKRYGFDDKDINKCLNEFNHFDKKDELDKLLLDYKKAYNKYLKKYDKNEAKIRTIKYLINKGYNYSLICEIKE